MYTENIVAQKCIVNLEAVATGSLGCYLVFGYCGKGWKWLHGNGILTETGFLCQFLTAVLGCRKHKLNIRLLKGRALPRVDKIHTVWSKYPIPFPQSVSVTKSFVLIVGSPASLVFASPLFFFAQLFMNHVYC